MSEQQKKAKGPELIAVEYDEKKLKEGMRVQAVFRDKKDRKAGILDIRYFKPI